MAAKPSTHVRCKPDLAEMISAVADAKGVKVPDYLDPLLRAQVLADYEEHKVLIEQIRENRRRFNESNPEE